MPFIEKPVRQEVSAIALAVLLQVHVAGEHVDVFGEAGAAEKAKGEADAAAARFKELFGVAPLRGAVVLTRDGRPAKDRKRDLAYTKNGAKWIWRWEPSKGAEPDETMAHELGHLFFVFWIHGTTPPAKKQYGSELPDWLDEGVACLLEGPRAREAYAAEVRRRARAGTTLPLAELFGGLHPISREESDVPRIEDRWLFYAQSWSVTAFLAEECGAAALRRVVATLRRGKRVQDALGAKGLPDSLEELEKRWKEWAARADTED